MRLTTPSFARRALGALLSGVLLFAASAEPWAQSSLWENRRSARASLEKPEFFPTLEPGAALSALAPDAAGESDEPLLKPLRGSPWWSCLPLAHTSLREAHIPRGPVDRLVIHIQDVHDNPEAQRNISRALLHVRRETGVDQELLIGLEGAQGAFFTDAMRTFPDRALMASVAGGFLERKLLTGAEHAALASERPIRLWGVEEPDLYRRNFEALRAGLAREGAAREALAGLARRAEALKARFYSPALREWDERASAYRESRLPLGEYVRFLAKTPSRRATPPSMSRFLAALDEEAALDFTRVEGERRELIEGLSAGLEAPELSRLVEESALFRTGRMSHARFHERLSAAARRAGLDLGRFPAFQRYVRYVSLVEAVDRRAFSGELESMEQGAAEAFLAGAAPEARRLFRADRALTLARKLADHALTPDGWREYGTAEIRGLPQTLAALEGGAAGEASLAELLAPFEEFYRSAEARNRAMVENLLRAAPGRRVSVLIAGGFHSPGLTALLKERGLAYVVLAPRVEKVDGVDYLDVFRRDQTPLDRLFAGEKLTFMRENGLPVQPMLEGSFRAYLLRTLLPGLESVARRRGLPTEDFRAALETSLGNLPYERPRPASLRGRAVDSAYVADPQGRRRKVLFWTGPEGATETGAHVFPLAEGNGEALFALGVSMGLADRLRGWIHGLLSPKPALDQPPKERAPRQTPTLQLAMVALLCLFVLSCVDGGVGGSALLYHKYQSLVTLYPHLTRFLTGALAGLLGDLVSQWIGRKPFSGKSMIFFTLFIGVANGLVFPLWLGVQKATFVPLAGPLLGLILSQPFYSGFTILMLILLSERTFTGKWPERQALGRQWWGIAWKDFLAWPLFMMGGVIGFAIPLLTKNAEQAGIYAFLAINIFTVIWSGFLSALRRRAAAAAEEVSSAEVKRWTRRCEEIEMALMKENPPKPIERTIALLLSLQAARAQGRVRVVLATGATRNRALATLRLLDLEDEFDAVFADPVRKAEAIGRTRRKAGVPAEECVMIGDTANDEAAAAEAGARFLNVPGDFANVRFETKGEILGNSGPGGVTLRKTRVFVFDMDGTLSDSTENNRRAWGLLGAEMAGLKEGEEGYQAAYDFGVDFVTPYAGKPPNDWMPPLLEAIGKRRETQRTEVRPPEQPDSVRAGHPELKAASDLNELDAESLKSLLKESFRSGRAKWTPLEGISRDKKLATVLVLKKVEGSWGVLVARRTMNAADRQGVFTEPGGKVDSPSSDQFESPDERNALTEEGILSPSDLDPSGVLESVPAAAVRELSEETAGTFSYRISHIAGRLDDLPLGGDKSIGVFVVIDPSDEPPLFSTNELTDPRLIPLDVLLAAPPGQAGPKAEEFLRQATGLESDGLVPGLKEKSLSNLARLVSIAANLGDRPELSGESPKKSRPANAAAHEAAVAAARASMEKDLALDYADKPWPLDELFSPEVLEVVREAETLSEEIVRETGRIISWVKAGNLEISRKEDGSIVTNADRGISLKLKEMILGHPKFGAHFLRSEEDVASPYDKQNRANKRAEADFVWIMDEIDGTSGFAEGGKAYCFMMTLCHKGYPIFALTFSPEEEKGGVVNSWNLLSGSRRNGLPVRTALSRSTSTVVSRTSSNRPEIQDKFRKGWGEAYRKRLGQLPEVLPRNGSHGHALENLTAGRWHVTSNPLARVWDMAPPAAILTFRGGSVRLWNGRRPFPLSREDLFGSPALMDLPPGHPDAKLYFRGNFPFVMTAGGVHREVADELIEADLREGAFTESAVDKLSPRQLKGRIQAAYRTGRASWTSGYDAWVQDPTPKKEWSAQTVLIRKVAGRFVLLVARRGKNGAFTTPGGKADQPRSDENETPADMVLLRRLEILVPSDVDPENRESIQGAGIRELREESGGAIRKRVSDFDGRLNDIPGYKPGVLVSSFLCVDDASDEPFRFSTRELVSPQGIPLSVLESAPPGEAGKRAEAYLRAALNDPSIIIEPTKKAVIELTAQVLREALWTPAVAAATHRPGLLDLNGITKLPFIPKKPAPTADIQFLGPGEDTPALTPETPSKPEEVPAAKADGRPGAGAEWTRRGFEAVSGAAKPDGTPIMRAPYDAAGESPMTTSDGEGLLLVRAGKNNGYRAPQNLAELAPPGRTDVNQAHGPEPDLFCRLRSKAPDEVLGTVPVEDGFSYDVAVNIGPFGSEALLFISREPESNRHASRKRLRDMFLLTKWRGSDHESWFNPLGGGATQPHWHLQSGRRRRGGIWDFIDARWETLRKSLSEAPGGVVYGEVEGLSARTRLFRGRDLEAILDVLWPELEDLNARNKPAPLLIRLLEDGTYEAAFSPFHWGVHVDPDLIINARNDEDIPDISAPDVQERFPRVQAFSGGALWSPWGCMPVYEDLPPGFLQDPVLMTRTADRWARARRQMTDWGWKPPSAGRVDPSPSAAFGDSKFTEKDAAAVLARPLERGELPRETVMRTMAKEAVERIVGLAFNSDAGRFGLMLRPVPGAGAPAIALEMTTLRTLILANTHYDGFIDLIDAVLEKVAHASVHILAAEGGLVENEGRFASAFNAAGEIFLVVDRIEDGLTDPASLVIRLVHEAVEMTLKEAGIGGVDAHDLAVAFHQAAAVHFFGPEGLGMIDEDFKRLRAARAPPPEAPPSRIRTDQMDVDDWIPESDPDTGMVVINERLTNSAELFLAIFKFQAALREHAVSGKRSVTVLAPKLSDVQLLTLIHVVEDSPAESLGDISLVRFVRGGEVEVEPVPQAKGAGGYSNALIPLGGTPADPSGGVTEFLTDKVPGFAQFMQLSLPWKLALLGILFLSGAAIVFAVRKYLASAAGPRTEGLDAAAERARALKGPEERSALEAVWGRAEPLTESVLPRMEEGRAYDVSGPDLENLLSGKGPVPALEALRLEHAATRPEVRERADFRVVSLGDISAEDLSAAVQRYWVKFHGGRATPALVLSRQDLKSLGALSFAWGRLRFVISAERLRDGLNRGRARPLSRVVPRTAEPRNWLSDAILPLLRVLETLEREFRLKSAADSHA